MYRLHCISGVVLSFTLSMTLTLPSTSAFERPARVTASVVGTPASLGEILVEAERVTQEEILWLARVIYSETKRPHEQELVAWVVRNRVETGYRGNWDYKSTVLDRYQFSAFNPSSRTRDYYMGMEWDSNARGFQRALSIAARVATAPADGRPFSKTTRHFYSARSMADGKAPAWAEDMCHVKLDRYVDPNRFRFYELIT